MALAIEGYVLEVKSWGKSKSKEVKVKKPKSRVKGQEEKTVVKS